MRIPQYFLICIVMAAMLTGIVSATIVPEYGTAVIDGQALEWTGQDTLLLPTDICRPITDGTTVIAQECIRYDCAKKTAYVFVWDEFDTPTPLLDAFGSGVDSAFIDGTPQYFDTDTGTANFQWWSSDGYSAWGYEASFPLEPGSYSFYTKTGFITDSADSFTMSTDPETLQVSCNGGVTPAPEFPSAFLPAVMIIGLLGAVLFIQRTREN